MKRFAVYALGILAVVFFLAGCQAAKKSPDLNPGSKVLAPLKGRHVSTIISNMSIIDPELGLKYSWIYDHRTKRKDGGYEYGFIFFYRENYGEMHDLDVTAVTDDKGMIEDFEVKQNY